MKTQNNQVTVKKAAIDLSNDSMINIELAKKALNHLTDLVYMGKNAIILSEVANNFANKKETSNIKALRKDNVLKGLESKMFQCQTAVKTRAMTSADNYADYAKAVKAMLSKKAPLSDKQKEQIKSIVAKAQVLRNGYLSKYAHDEICFKQLAGHYSFEVAETQTDSQTQPETETQTQPETETQTQPELVAESASINMETFKNLVDSIQLLDDAQLAMDILQAKMAELVAQQEAKLQHAS